MKNYYVETMRPNDLNNIIWKIDGDSNIIKPPNIVWSKLTFWLTSIQSNQGWAQLKMISSLGKYLQELKMISYKHWFIVVPWHPGIFQNIMLHIVPGFYWGETTFSSSFLWRIIRLRNDLYEIQQIDRAASMTRLLLFLSKS